MRIYNLGSLNIDYVYQVPHFVRPGETLASRHMEIFPGGKGLNQSVALGRAGAEVIHGGFIQEKDLWLLEVLQQSHVYTSYIKGQTSLSTGHAIIQVDEGGQNGILLFPGANHLFTPAYAEEVLAKAGSQDMLLLQNEVNCLDAILEIGHKKNMQIAFNPSPFDRRILELPLAYVDWWFLNEVEGEELTGRSAAEEILEELHGRFPKSNIVLTLGEKGSRFRNAFQSLQATAVPAKVVDTTAAGDTFTGYFLATVGRGANIAQALEQASAAAALAVSQKGASSSIPWKHQVDESIWPPKH